MPNTVQESMEDLSFAYVNALCAYHGYTFDRVTRDNDGVDDKYFKRVFNTLDMFRIQQV